MVRQKKKASPFAANLKELLRKKNLTQKQISVLCHVSPSVVNGWLSGTVPYDLIAIARLAEVLDTDFQELLTSIPSPKSVSLCNVFHIQDENALSGVFKIEVKRLVEKDQK